MPSARETDHRQHRTGACHAQGGSGPVRWVPDHGGYWVVSRHRDVAKVLADASRFSNMEAEIPRPSVVHALPIPFQLDPPHHGPVRRVLDAFLPKPVTDRLEAPVRAAARGLSTGLPARGEFELVDDFAVPLVAAGLWHLLGLRWPDESLFIDRSREMMRRLWDVDETAPMERLTGRGGPAGAAPDVPRPLAEQLGPDDLLEELVLEAIERGLERDQGLLAGLVRTTWGTSFADRTMDIHNLAVGLVGVALVNTVSTLVRAVEHLGTHPADRHTLLERRDRIAPAVEELLRLYPPQSPGRIVVRDIRLRGERLRVGDAVMASIPEANRDTEVFSHPDRFILDRASKPHLAFGAGRHHCVGASFARMMLAVALEELHAAVPQYRVSGWSAEISHSPLRVPPRRLWVEPTPDRSAPA